MIRILTKDDRHTHAALFEQMFRSRAMVFHDRLGWDVKVRDGLEYDRYDTAESPLYVVVVDDKERLRASLRLLPTTGENMLANEFSSFFDDPIDIVDPTTWECTRLCVAPPVAEDTFSETDPLPMFELCIGLAELCQQSGIEAIVAVFYDRMIRIATSLGWKPEILADSKPEFGNIKVGIFDVSDRAIASMKKRYEKKALMNAGRSDRTTGGVWPTTISPN